MRDEERKARHLARLEEARARSEARLENQRERVQKRFERMRERIVKDEHEPNDRQQRIIEAALELVDEEGLGNISLRKLAAKLDMQAPALYWHFKNKESLVDYMAEAILHEEFRELHPRTKEEPWQDWLIDIMQRLRKAMRTHRDGARVVAGAHLYPAITLMKLFEISMESLMSAGVELQRANLIIATAVHFVFGHVIEEQSSPSLDENRDFMASDLLKDYPLMSESVRQSHRDALAGYDEFDDALRLIIKGAASA